MPGRSSTRERCTSAGADTTTTASTRAIAAGLEQERNIEHHDLLAARLGLGQQPPFGFVHQRMNDRLEPGERGAIAENTRGELGAIDLAARGRARKRRLDRGTASPSYSRCTTASASCTGTPSSAKKRAVVDFPIPTEPVRPRMNMPSRIATSISGTDPISENATTNRPRIHAASSPSRRRHRSSAKQRQPENDEMVALDALEQLDAGLLQLVAADAAP